MLIKLVQSGVLSDNWEESCPPAVWMRRQIRKGAEGLKPEEWMEITFQNSAEFVTTELDRIYDPKVDYFATETMKDSDDHHGNTVDCYVFAKLYLMVVVLYIGDPIPNASKTIVMDRITNSTYQKEGFFPNEKPPGPALLELVRYFDRHGIDLRIHQIWMVTAPPKTICLNRKRTRPLYLCQPTLCRAGAEFGDDFVLNRLQRKNLHHWKVAVEEESNKTKTWMSLRRHLVAREVQETTE
jgi:hypothetical protein